MSTKNSDKPYLLLKFGNASRRNLIIAVTTGLTVLGVGCAVFFTHASPFFGATEPENGSLAGVTVGSDSNASGGRYVQFNALSGGTGTAGSFADYYKRWSNGPNPSGNQAYYPIGVWIQDPTRLNGGVANGTNYQNIGIDLDLGLWDDPTFNIRYQGVIDTKWHDMPGISRVSQIKALTGTNASYFTGYLLDDEADMNYPNDPSTYSTAAEKNRADATRAADPTRPIYANYGKCLAIYQWVGCHAQAGYDTDMKAYCDLADLVSADFYGWTDPWEETSYHGAWTYGAAISNMHKYCGATKPVWGFVEGANPWDPSHPAPTAITADQMEQAIWNMVVHGANGILYFAHDFSNGLQEDAMLSRPDVRARAASVDARLKSLAPILNSYSQSGVSATGTNSIPVSTMYKKYGGANYVFAAADGNNSKPMSGSTTGTITVPVSSGTATVVGENRTVPISGGKITDSFSAYQMHEYQF